MSNEDIKGLKKRSATLAGEVDKKGKSLRSSRDTESEIQ